MSKRVVPFVCVLVLAVSSLAVAQTTMTGGVKAGIDFANVSISANGTNISPSSRTGLAAGVFFDLEVAPNIAIQPEALVIMKGASAGADIIGFGSTATLKLNYLEIPVLVKYRFNSEYVATPYVFGGPALGILLQAKESSGGVDVDVKSDMNSTDLGLAIGGGVEYRIFLAEIRYTIGLRDIIANNTSASGFTVKNRALMLMGGVRF